MSQTGRHLAMRHPGRPSGLAFSAIALAVVGLLAVSFVVFRRSHPAAGCGGNQLPLDVVAAPDMAGILRRTATDYTRTNPTVGGRCVTVSVQSLEASQASAALAKGWTGAVAVPRPDVWVPDSSSWAQLLELQLQAAHQADPMPADRPSLATSPLVIAMPQPMARALGWPQRPIGWSDLLTALQKPSGWSAFQHPEWGPFKLGKTNPTLSTSGLEGIIGTLTATLGAGGISEKVLAAHSQQMRELILGMERAPGEQVDTDANFLTNLQQADDGGQTLKYVSAVPLGEKQVLDYNLGNPGGDPAGVGDHAKPKVPLAAIYPKEGTLEADHPWLVLREPWVDDAKRAAASDFLLYLKSPTVQGRFQAAGFRSARGQPGAEIGPDSGLLPDQPKRVMETPGPLVLGATLKAWDQTKRIANLLAVYDVSGSMGEVVPGTGGKTKMDLAKQAAMASLRLFTSESDVGTWEFSTNLDGKRDYRQAVAIAPVGSKEPGGGTHLQRLQQRLVGLAPTHGDTALYDTALAAYDYVKQHYAR